MQPRHVLNLFAIGKKKNHRDKERRREKGDAAFFVRVRDRQRDRHRGGKEKNKAGERSKSERDREVFARVPDDCFFFLRRVFD